MSAILILGAAVWADGPSPTLVRRTLHAARLAHADPGAHLIPCGGTGRYPPSEAAAMRDLLMAAGFPAGRIRCEDRSTNTLENIAFAQPILSELGDPPVVIVSDAYHRRRAMMVARSLELQAAFHPCPSPEKPSWRYRRQGLREVLAWPLTRWRLARWH